MCKFIADPYAIEVTRRQQFVPDTANWKYDEDVFVVALNLQYITGSHINLRIDTGMTDAGNTVISPDTVYNVRISPERNAIRWAERFFEVRRDKNVLEFTAGTGNVDAKGKPADSAYPGMPSFYLEDSGVGNVQSEKGDILRKVPVLKPEILSFDYPFSFADYCAVFRNPYGSVVVDGEVCYIQKIEPNLLKGLASFELIPVADG
jgi:hypothetical protein